MADKTIQPPFDELTSGATGVNVLVGAGVAVNVRVRVKVDVLAAVAAVVGVRVDVRVGVEVSSDSGVRVRVAVRVDVEVTVGVFVMVEVAVEVEVEVCATAALLTPTTKRPKTINLRHIQIHLTSSREFQNITPVKPLRRCELCFRNVSRARTLAEENNLPAGLVK